MLYEILGALVTTLQVVVLLVVLAVFFAVGPFAMLYLMSEGFREFWIDYEDWLDRKIMKRRYKKHKEQYGEFAMLVSYAEADVAATTWLYKTLTTATETEDADSRK